MPQNCSFPSLCPSGDLCCMPCPLSCPMFIVCLSANTNVEWKQNAAHKRRNFHLPKLWLKHVFKCYRFEKFGEASPQRSRADTLPFPAFGASEWERMDGWSSIHKLSSGAASCSGNSLNTSKSQHWWARDGTTVKAKQPFYIKGCMSGACLCWCWLTRLAKAAIMQGNTVKLIQHSMKHHQTVSDAS